MPRSPRNPAPRSPPAPAPLLSVEQLERELPDPGPLPEHMLQQLLLAHLDRIPGAGFWRANTGAGFVPGGRLVRFGKPGQSDLLGLVMGRFVGIEVKDPHRGRQNPDQRAFQAWVEARFGVYLLATDFLTTMRQVLDLAARTPRPLPS